MEDCIFCKIIAGKVPADVVYVDNKVFAFKDINPAAPVHILLIPRKHIASFNDLEAGDRDLLGHMALVLKKLAANQGLSENGYRIIVNCGSDGGQEVFHLHYHLLGGRPLGRMLSQ